MGVKILKATPTVLILFRPNFSLMFPLTVVAKLADTNFEI